MVESHDESRTASVDADETVKVDPRRDFDLNRAEPSRAENEPVTLAQ